LTARPHLAIIGTDDAREGSAIDTLPVKPKTIYTHTYASPIGPLYLAVDRWGCVIRVGFTPETDFGPELNSAENKYACGELELQLDEYFAGDRDRFSLELLLDGTDFQRSVWTRLQKIPYGSVTTYGEIAQKIGRKDAARAVGNAVAHNPLPILVPCHRVVPADGSLGSYAARSLTDGSGINAKRALLNLEGAALEQAKSA
jgi:methylated-DNA-[protein]-cysteine S-methyltransferase